MDDEAVGSSWERIEPQWDIDNVAWDEGANGAGASDGLVVGQLDGAWWLAGRLEGGGEIARGREMSRAAAPITQVFVAGVADGQLELDRLMGCGCLEQADGGGAQSLRVARRKKRTGNKGEGKQKQRRAEQ